MYKNGWKGEARFKKKYYIVNSDTGCWEWIGCKWKGGYGYTRQNGKRQSAHRYMYELYISPIQKELDLLHCCDNPSCVNPKHLIPGTHSDNMKDMYNKNRRNQKGMNNGNYKHGGYVK